MADVRGLQPRGCYSSRPGPNPGRGTTYSTTTEIIMAKKKATKPKKRGPKEEVLRITEDPKTALDRLLKKKPS